MYAVIFRAKAANQDKAYSDTVARMRELAFEKYGCLDFVAVTEGEDEIAISYWPDETAVLRWKQDHEHSLAQQFGRKKWYQSYRVDVVEVKRSYSFNPQPE
ncbi:antibiotic biosynthesis monooxygenase family protein [Aliamphritea spongicola]|uniref:antibiotic biosynthesis monooxygenase family protein n=1 Tax=Aliamphritea spongicola TaxID=707589 RepID=UPI00196B5E03|nr:antibiotic biosynthesis monooxygenase [Aliamphritea spongicola]MBN3561312.1 antibiotic biosynthesis monooxygenase [Aliamphritea spongicola]